MLEYINHKCKMVPNIDHPQIDIFHTHLYTKSSNSIYSHSL